MLRAAGRLSSGFFEGRLTVTPGGPAPEIQAPPRHQQGALPMGTFLGPERLPRVRRVQDGDFPPTPRPGTRARPSRRRHIARARSQDPRSVLPRAAPGPVHARPERADPTLTREGRTGRGPGAGAVPGASGARRPGARLCWPPPPGCPRPGPATRVPGAAAAAAAAGRAARGARGGPGFGASSFCCASGARGAGRGVVGLRRSLPRAAPLGGWGCLARGARELRGLGARGRRPGGPGGGGRGRCCGRGHWCGRRGAASRHGSRRAGGSHLPSALPSPPDARRALLLPLRLPRPARPPRRHLRAALRDAGRAERILPGLPLAPALRCDPRCWARKKCRQNTQLGTLPPRAIIYSSASSRFPAGQPQARVQARPPVGSTRWA